MPYTVSITNDEANLLTEAEVEGIEGSIFTYEPRATLEIMAVVAERSAPDAPGRKHLTDRLSTLYGGYLAAVARKRESAQASDDASVFATRINDTPDATPVPMIGSPGFETAMQDHAVREGYENPVNVPNDLGVDAGLDELPSPAPARKSSKTRSK